MSFINYSIFTIPIWSQLYRTAIMNISFSFTLKKKYKVNKKRKKKKTWYTIFIHLLIVINYGTMSSFCDE